MVFDEELEENLQSEPTLLTPLAVEYDPDELKPVGALAAQESSRSDFGSIPSESLAWMKILRRMRNLLESQKSGIARLRKQQVDLPTANELISNPRYDVHQPVYEMERRWQASIGAMMMTLSMCESLQQEIDNIERGLRQAGTESRR